MSSLAVRSFRVLMLAVLLSACAVPEELKAPAAPERPPDKLATIVTFAPISLGRELRVLSVDGKPLTQYPSAELPGGRIGSEMQVPAGEHELVIRYWHTWFFDDEMHFLMIPVALKAQRYYQLRLSEEGEKSTKTVRIWIEDNESREIAGPATIIAKDR